MDVYVLSPTFERIEMIENFESMIWTERYQAHGEFRLDLRETTFVRSNLRHWQYLETSESNRPMMIERLERPQQLVDKNLIKIRGRSVSAFLKLRNNIGMSYGQDAEVVTGQASDIMRYMVDRYCVNPATAGAVNVIPNFTAANTALGPMMRLALERGDLYSIVQTIAYVSGLGFIVRMDRDLNKLVLQATSGIDRTAPGSLYREYSVDGESLVNPGSFESIEGFKTHARMIGKKTGTDVYSPGYPNPSGWDRRTMVIKADDIGTAADYVPGPGDPPATTIEQDVADLVERGKAELREQANRFQRLVNGDVPTANWNATYYGLGDIVWVKDNQGVKSKMRISEQIWSVDKAGEKRTPTFEEYYTG